MTEIPEEFLLSNKDIENETWLDTTKDGHAFLKPCCLKQKPLEASKIVEDDWPPDGCGIGVGSSYRESDWL
jgi:hypothetical protein